MQTKTDSIVMGPKECQACLDELMPMVGNYDWIWSFLRRRALRGGFPDNSFRVLRRFLNPRKPYFIGKTSDGVAFMGDWRDQPSLAYAVLPGVNSEIVTFIKERLKNKEGAYLDIGTNLGVVAATLALGLKDTQSVIAFEPVMETAKRAAATFALNNLTNVRLLPIAIGDTDGEISFFDAIGHSDSSSAKPVQNDKLDWSERKIACRKLDSLFKDKVIESAGLIKIDVEGYEPQAIAGSSQIISQQKPEIIYEFNYDIAPHLGWHPLDLVDVISRDGGYNFQVLTEEGQLCPFPPPRTGNGHCDIVCTAEDKTGAQRREKQA